MCFHNGNGKSILGDIDQNPWNMELQHIARYLKRSERLLLGSSGKLAESLGMPPLIVRIVLVVLTLVFIPLGILLYLGIFWFAGKKRNGKLVLALLGGLAGIPLGYYFQSDMVQGMAGGVSGYLRKFSKIVDAVELYRGNGLEVVWDAFTGIVVLALLGLALGHFIDLSHQRNKINQKSK